jgi:hypothetical protein
MRFRVLDSGFWIEGKVSIQNSRLRYEVEDLTLKIKSPRFKN